MLTKWCRGTFLPPQFAAFEDDVGIYLVTEYASKGDVFGELQRRNGAMSERDAVRAVVEPFLSALHYLHSHNIIHRDIKPENLLLSANGTLKVAGGRCCCGLLIELHNLWQCAAADLLI